MKRQGLISQSALLLFVLVPASVNNPSQPLSPNNAIIPASVAAPVGLDTRPRPSTGPIFLYAHDKLWKYLRCGLNYLESPQPLQEPESVPCHYVHPDGLGFGAYGFSPAAYQDVQRVYPYFRQYSWDQLLDSSRLYELANQAFADWLLKNLNGYIPDGNTQEQIFDVLHQAWNLGLGGFKSGRNVVASRLRRAEEFKTRFAASI